MYECIYLHSVYLFAYMRVQVDDTIGSLRFVNKLKFNSNPGKLSRAKLSSSSIHQIFI